MSNEKLGQEPAFPETYMDGSMSSGMSKRFYAACAAMQGMLGNRNSDMVYPQISKLVIMSYEFADELLKQETHE